MLTDITGIDTEGHRTELKVDDFGHGTGYGVSALAVTSVQGQNESGSIASWSSDSRSGAFDEEVDSVGVSGRKVHQSSTCRTSYKLHKVQFRWIVRRELTGIKDRHPARRHGDIAIDHHTFHPRLPEPGPVGDVQNLSGLAVLLGQIKATDGQLAGVLPVSYREAQIQPFAPSDRNRDESALTDSTEGVSHDCVGDDTGVHQSLGQSPDALRRKDLRVPRCQSVLLGDDVGRKRSPPEQSPGSQQKA